MPIDMVNLKNIFNYHLNKFMGQIIMKLTLWVLFGDTEIILVGYLKNIVAL